MIDEDYKKYLLSLFVGLIFIFLLGVLYMFFIIYWCEYQSVLCFKDPCDPRKVCSIEIFGDNIWNNNTNFDILENIIYQKIENL